MAACLHAKGVVRQWRGGGCHVGRVFGTESGKANHARPLTKKALPGSRRHSECSRGCQACMLGWMPSGRAALPSTHPGLCQLLGAPPELWQPALQREVLRHIGADARGDLIGNAEAQPRELGQLRQALRRPDAPAAAHCQRLQLRQGRQCCQVLVVGPPQHRGNCGGQHHCMEAGGVQPELNPSWNAMHAVRVQCSSTSKIGCGAGARATCQPPT